MLYKYITQMKHDSDLGLFDFCYNLELCFCIISKNTTEQKKLVHLFKAACKFSLLFGIYIVQF